MMNLLTFETLSYFAATNAAIVKTPVRGIVLTFHGLGFSQMFSEPDDYDRDLAGRGILRVIPYYNPWCWMNRQTVDYVDEILDVLFAHFALAEDTPIISTGGSMGGLCSLTYAAYAKRTPAAVVSNCPVCDLPYHFTERPDLPRTLYSAFGSYDGTMDEALCSASPLHLAQNGKMPPIPYYIFHCTADTAVSKEQHSDKFVAAMQTCGRSVTYTAVPDRGHCDLSPEARVRYDALPISVILDEWDD
ncbi:MAG: hypothetical protein E7604_12435 [Ruminococcaceae bacterium]|nr:hypothetical protein [Oscillospiraceae bacterium]